MRTNIEVRSVLPKIAVFLFGLSVAQCYASDPFSELELSVRQQVKTAQQKKAASDFEDYKVSRRESFKDYKKKFREEFEEYRLMASQAGADYRDRLSKEWAQPQVSSNKRWVQYERDYRLRKLVNFEEKVIRFSYPTESSSRLSVAEARKELANLLVMTRKEAFEKDEVAQEIELAGKNKLETLKTDEVENTPILISYLLGKVTIEQKALDELVDYMLEARKVSQSYEGPQRVESWTFPLQSPLAMADKQQVKGSAQVEGLENHDNSGPRIFREAGESVWKVKYIDPGMSDGLPVKARGFVSSINDGSREFELSAELILAIIETESAFNPMAKSPIPAYGLMQIVPQSAGQDATAKLFGKPKILSPSYLYNSENNIRVGSAYFNILYYRYFEDVKDPLSRLYSSIAAYNTGPGNVAKAMLGKSMSLTQAAKKINTMKANEVYEHLMDNLPYEETVHYLERVSQRINKYEQLLATSAY